jgi:hypothetical protein
VQTAEPDSKDRASRTPEAFIEDPTRDPTAVASIPSAPRLHGNPKTERGPPLFVSIDDAALLTAESAWTVKQRLRDGTYRARKAGRRTLVEYESILAYAMKLPAATFAPRRPRPDLGKRELTTS